VWGEVEREVTKVEERLAKLAKVQHQVFPEPESPSLSSSSSSAYLRGPATALHATDTDESAGSEASTDHPLLSRLPQLHAELAEQDAALRAMMSRWGTEDDRDPARSAAVRDRLIRDLGLRDALASMHPAPVTHHASLVADGIGEDEDGVSVALDAVAESESDRDEFFSCDEAEGGSGEVEGEAGPARSTTMSRTVRGRLDTAGFSDDEDDDDDEEEEDDVVAADGTGDDAHKSRASGLPRIGASERTSGEARSADDTTDVDDEEEQPVDEAALLARFGSPYDEDYSSLGDDLPVSESEPAPRQIKRRLF
jgi:hypothetical protein